jgi:hypothetical protein
MGQEVMMPDNASLIDVLIQLSLIMLRLSNAEYF